MQNRFEHKYPFEDWTEAGLVESFEGSEPSALPTRADREAWRSIRDDSVVGPLAEMVLEQAEAVSGEAAPPTPASLWLAYHREDNAARQAFIDRFQTRLSRLRLFALAECLEAEGRFLDDVLDYAWAFCERTAWFNPSNDRIRDVEHLDGLPRASAPPEDRTIDLHARIGFHLAETDYVLGEALNAGLRERIREEADDHVITPYESRDDFWWWSPPTNSWNAACHSAGLGTALYLEDDPERLARLTLRALDSLEHFLAMFGADGGSVEGPDYWSGGFFRFIRLAELLEARTGGEYSLFDVPVVEQLAKYPLRIMLSPGTYPLFGDTSPEVYLRPCHACRLGTEYDLPGLIVEGKRSLADRPIEDLTSIRNLVWCAGLPDVEAPTPAPRELLSDIQWWIARAAPDDPSAPVVAARGGANAESHMHADVGTFVYHVDEETLIGDLGTVTYPTNYFGEGRFSYTFARSLGHPVPHVVGREQRTEPRRDRERTVMADPPEATITKHVESNEREAFRLELADCYPPETNLKSLERRFAMTRPSGALTVTDDAAFAPTDVDRWLESVLVSYHPMERTAEGLVVAGDRARATVAVEGDVGPEEVWIERLQAAVPEDYSETPPAGRDVWRARVGPATGETPTIRLRIEPAESP